MKKTVKIVIIGGHLAPALAVIERLKDKPDQEIYYIGRKHALEGDQSLSLEYQTIKQLQIPFYNLYTGRLSRIINLQSAISLFKIPIGLVMALVYVRRIRPDLVLGFGGYLSLPVCLVSRMLGIPIIIHEQTPILGLSNRIAGHFANKILLSFEKTLYADKFSHKIIVTGNPIRRSYSQNNRNNNYFKKGKFPLIYITGGSSGSHQINMLISPIIPYLVKKYQVIHQCGEASKFNDFAMLEKIRKSLDESSQKNYLVHKVIEVNTVASIMSKADLIISRSGANTVCEIAWAKVPSLLIPLGWSRDNEQILNAKLLEKTGSAIILRDEDLTPAKIKYFIDQMMENLTAFKAKAQQNSKLISLDAADNICKMMTQELKVNNAF